MSSKIDCVKEVLERYQYKHVGCNKIRRLGDSLTCENEAPVLPDGSLIRIKLRYKSESGLMELNKIEDRETLNDITEDYKENINIKNYVDGLLGILNDEIVRYC